MSAALRIALLVDPIAAWIGGAQHPAELARALAARGHEVRVFGLAPAPSEGAQVGVERNLAPSVLSFLPQALIAYDARSPAAWLGARVARRLAVPLALVESRSWSERSRLQRSLWRLGERLWGSFVRRSASAVLALDAGARDAALRRGFAEGSVQLVPGGVDVERYRPGLSSPELSLHRVRGRILAARCGANAQREELLLQAFACTVGQRDDWSLVFASRGGSARELRLVADRLGVGSRVHFLALEEASLPAVLSSSTLFAAPGEYPQLELDLARALACGVPILTERNARSVLFVSADEHGLLAQDDQPESWPALLRSAASSPERRRRWGAAARRTAVQRFSWGAVAERFEAALREGRQPASDGEQRLPWPAPGA